MGNQLLFYTVVLLTNIIQCITGFAGTVIAMPFSIMLIGYQSAKPILNVLGILASLGVMIPYRKNINKGIFLKAAGVMLPGIIASYFISADFVKYEKTLYKVLGAVIIAFAVYNFVMFIMKKTDKKLSPVISGLLLVFSGIIHGLFVCGGPLLVVYASSKIKDKNEFRATLSAIWTLLNTVILLEDISFGYFDPVVIKMLVISSVVLVVSIITGNLISKRLSKNLFLLLTYVLMLVSGIFLIIK